MGIHGNKLKIVLKTAKNAQNPPKVDHFSDTPSRMKAMTLEGGHCTPEELSQFQDASGVLAVFTRRMCCDKFAKRWSQGQPFSLLQIQYNQ